MSISDTIQVIAICVSLIVSLIAILQTQKSIKQTENMIEEANRPVVSVYIESVTVGEFQKYITVKNFGQTAATILSITFDKELDEANEDRKLGSLVGATIAPNQKFTSFLEPDYNKTVITHISYKDVNNKIYKEKYILKTDLTNSLFWISTEKTSDTAVSTAIKDSAIEILKSFK